METPYPAMNRPLPQVVFGLPAISMPYWWRVIFFLFQKKYGFRERLRGLPDRKRFPDCDIRPGVFRDGKSQVYFDIRKSEHLIYDL